LNIIDKNNAEWKLKDIEAAKEKLTNSLKKKYKSRV
jgi:hypothetical protein